MTEQEGVLAHDQGLLERACALSLTHAPHQSSSLVALHNYNTPCTDNHAKYTLYDVYVCVCGKLL